MRRENYKRLGEYISPYLEKNVGLKVTLSQGINNNKYFQTPRQVAVDSENDQIVRTGQFAYNKATTRNGEKISIAYREGPDCTVSSAYQVFYIKDEEKLNPHYLLMWFKRPEFDRYARFKSFGSAHEFFTWEEMCNVYLPIPSIEEQRKIVAEYQAVEQRIENNNRLIKAFEDTAQAIYHHTFVEKIDPENLPEGWRWGTIGDFCKEIRSGGTPNRNIAEYWDSKDYPWLKTGEVQNNVIVDVEEYISEQGYKNSSANLIPRDTVVMAMYGGGTVSNVAYLDCDTTTNQACCNMICKNREDAAFLFFHLLANQEEIKRMANGGAQENLSQTLISQLLVLICNNNLTKQQLLVIIDILILIYRENRLLDKIKNLLLSKLS